MSNIMNDLHAVGLNPFGVQLVAESLLKSPLAQLTTKRPQGFFFPIKRSDCPGWIGARFTLEAVPEAASDQPWQQINAQAAAQGITLAQIAITLAKVHMGTKPDDDMWNDLDHAALELALGHKVDRPKPRLEDEEA